MDKSQVDQDLKYVKLGILMALVGGIIWALDSIFMEKALDKAPFSSAHWLIGALSAVCLHDTLAGVFTLARNIKAGKVRELPRTVFSKPGRYVLLAGALGGPLGMGGYVAGLKFAGAAYVLPITSLYPVVATVIAVFFLKERVNRTAWFGLLLCIAGAILVGCKEPEQALGGSGFYLGIGLALLAAFGWGLEGVFAAKGMDLLDPDITLNVYQFTSAFLYLVVILPLAGGWGVLFEAINSPGGAYVALAALAAAVSYGLWYKSMNRIGVSRSMALNTGYVLWVIIFSALFTETKLTGWLVAGAVSICIGMLFVVQKPHEMVNLRKA